MAVRFNSPILFSNLTSIDIDFFFQNFKMMGPTYTLTEYCYQRSKSFLHTKGGRLKHSELQA